MRILLQVAAAFLAAWVLTGLMRRASLSMRLMDVPNQRSSHSQSTPRGGGVAIVATFLSAVGYLTAAGPMPASLGLLLIVSGACIAMIGFADDRFQLAARWRFLVHVGTAAWVMWQLGPLPPTQLLGNTVDFGIFGSFLCGLFIVWMINLVNFMDGIDGIASVEAITVGLGGTLCWWAATGTSLWFVPAVFAACVAGFLIWNYPPAKIFMGDAGSGFIGVVLAVLALWTSLQATHVFWSWLILVGVFMVDATTTLVRRVRRGEKFHEAHRTHAYQYSSRLFRSHKRVSLGVGAINILWLLPIALGVALQWLEGVIALAIAYAPLIWLAFHYKAGVREAQEQ